MNPPRPLLVFDGDCGFCTTSANRAHRWLGVTVAPWQALDIEALGLTIDDVNTAAWWVDAVGGTWPGHEAAAHALIAGGPVWRVLGRLLLLRPLAPLAAALYRLVAANRYRLPGSTDACRLPGRPDQGSSTAPTTRSARSSRRTASA